jgi:hypothetical protein
VEGARAGLRAFEHVSPTNRLVGLLQSTGTFKVKGCLFSSLDRLDALQDRPDGLKNAVEPPTSSDAIHAAMRNPSKSMRQPNAEVPFPSSRAGSVLICNAVSPNQ